LTGKIIINQERCKGCGYCIIACPHNLIGKADFFNSKGFYPAEYAKEASCPGKGCMLCYLMCPEVAIEVYKEDEPR